MRTAFALASLTVAALSSGGAAARLDPAGTYSRSTPAPGRLSLAPSGSNLWQVTLSGGGRPDGAATGADCLIEAEGELRGDVLRATVASTRPARLEIRFSAGAARVTTAYQGCGVGVDLNGTYRREGHRP
jgi:hypothetical protein